MEERQNRFARDLDRLVEQGRWLHMAIQCETQDEFRARIVKLYKGGEAEFMKKIPNFKEDYQAWYSEALAFIRQVLPDRLDDFRSYYEYPRVRKVTTSQNYMIRDYLQGLQITRELPFETEIVVDGSAAIPEFRQQLSIIEAARVTLESSLLDLTTILQADLYDSEVDSARALGKVGHLRAAGAVCGVVIEKHLKQICANHKITVRKRNPSISDFNELLKKEGTISVPQWRSIQLLADIRNICDHAKEREPTREEIDDLVAGTAKILKTVF